MFVAFRRERVKMTQYTKTTHLVKYNNDYRWMKKLKKMSKGTPVLARFTTKKQAEEIANKYNDNTKHFVTYAEDENEGVIN